MEIITHHSAKLSRKEKKKLRTFTGVFRSVEGGLIMKRAVGMWEGNKRLTSLDNQSHLFPSINQLFSTPQVPRSPLPN